MKIFLLGLLIGIVFGLPTDNESIFKEKFDDFIDKYGKIYSTPEEKAFR